MARIACLLLLLLPLASGCGGPFFVFPGGELRGEVVDEVPGDWSFLEARWVDLETRPSDPYSVELNYTVLEGRLYIDPAEGRRWLDHIRADPRVRARFDGRIYLLQAKLVASPESPMRGFDPDRFVYELVPRD